MPSLTYIGEPDRVYPSLGLTPTPGESYDVAEDPQDGRWGAVSAPGAPAPTPAPAAAPTPAPTPSVTAEPTTTTEA
jgi:hypothetical protein